MRIYSVFAVALLLSACAQTPKDIKSSQGSIKRHYETNKNYKDVASCIVNNYDENITFGLLNFAPNNSLRVSESEKKASIISNLQGATIFVTELEQPKEVTHINLYASGYQMHFHTQSMVAKADISINGCL